MVPNAEYTLFEKMGFRNKRVTVTKVCKMQTFARKKTMKSLSHCVTHVSGVIALKKIRFEINMISAYLAFSVIEKYIQLISYIQKKYDQALTV